MEITATGGTHTAPRNKISRSLADWHVSMISVGGIIGAGLFVGTSATIAASGPSVLLAYLGAGAIVWFVMLVLGELSLKYGTRSSFISHISTILGRRSGFVAGWSYILLWVVTGGAQAVAGGAIINMLTGLPPLVGSLGLIAVALLLNSLPVRVYGKSEAFLSVLKLAALVAFIGLGIAWMALTPRSSALVHSNLFEHGGFFPLGLAAVPAVIPMIVQTFTGCEITFVASVESENPQHNIRRAVFRLPFIVLLFYVGSAFIIVCLRPWTEVTPGYSPFLLVMRYLSIPSAGIVTISVTLVAIMSCLNSSKYVVSRILRELTDLGSAPALLARTTPAGTPVIAVLLTTLIEILIVVSAATSPSHAYTVLLGASGTLILFCYLMASLACLRVHKDIRRKLVRVLAAVSAVSMILLFVFIPFQEGTRLEGIIAFSIVFLIYILSFIKRPGSVVKPG